MTTGKDISLGQFLEQLVLRFDRDKVTMPLRDEKPWHVFFYSLKKSPEKAGKPTFLKEMLFDWDGPYPRSPELADQINAMHWTGCVKAANPQYDEITLNGTVKRVWSQAKLEKDLSKFVGSAVRLARREFAP